MRKGKKNSEFKSSSTMMRLLFGFLLICLISSEATLKEHKIHNIVLYPDRHSWCKITPIKQIISHPGCKTKTFENNVCVGQCFSFSVPKTIPETPNDDKLHYCDSCRPSNTTWESVSLLCPGENDRPISHEKKLVEIISDCSCQSCIPVDNEVIQDDEISSDTDTDYYSMPKHTDRRAELESLEAEEEKIINTLESKEGST